MSSRFLIFFWLLLSHGILIPAFFYSYLWLMVLTIEAKHKVLVSVVMADEVVLLEVVSMV